MSDSSDFAAGFVTAVIAGFAVYGAVKAIEEASKTPEQRVLENLGRDLRAIDAAHNGNARALPCGCNGSQQIPYYGGDNENE